VATILEGSVRRVDSRVRISSQLVDAETEEHLWAETYDRDLTDVFAIQSDVAQKIALALEATLTPEEKSYIEEKPTENMEAYDYFLKGNYYWMTKSTKEGNVKAAQMYERAIELDPEFALAYARLSITHTALYSHWDHTNERMLEARTTLEKAISLAPDHPEVQFAQGRYYERCLVDNDRALDEYKVAFQGLPSSGEIAMELGLAYQRSGQWEQAEKYLLKSFELDPVFTSIFVGKYYHWQHDWENAKRYFSLGITSDPERAFYYEWMAWNYIIGYGALEKARQILDEGMRNVDPGLLALPRFWTEFYARDYQKALIILGSHPSQARQHLLKGKTYSFLKEENAAGAEFDSARILYEQLVKDVPLTPNYHRFLGRAYAGLGMKEEAIREGEKAVEIVPISKNAISGPSFIWSLGRTYAMVGEYDLAIEQLELVLSNPAPYSKWDAKLDPSFDPLREHPRFQALLEK
jgi:tetratricopeptide (TPR) repeat protein